MPVCPKCGEDYSPKVFEKFGRCSECEEIINEDFFDRIPKPKKYGKMSTKNHNEKYVPQKTENIQISKDVGNISVTKTNRKRDDAVEDKKNEVTDKIKGNDKKDSSTLLQTKAENVEEDKFLNEKEKKLESDDIIDTIPNFDEADDIETNIEIADYDDVENYEDLDEESLENNKSIENVIEIDEIESEVQINEEEIEELNEQEINAQEQENPNSKKTATSIKETSKNVVNNVKGEIKKKIVNKYNDELEADYDSNKDGYYNDVIYMESPKPDMLSAQILIKVALIAIMLLLIILFLIYYA